MKKLLFLLILVLLFPITVFAKTPTLEETLNVIRNINNVVVLDGVTVNSASVDGENIYFYMDGLEIIIPYTFTDNVFSFTGGGILVDENNKLSGDIYDNAYPSFLYMILENKSAIPYDFNNYYSTDGIAEIVNREFKVGEEYREPTNTFGFSLAKMPNSLYDNEYQITYHYHLDGDYPILETEVSGDTFENPATGNYNVLITIMLISVLCIGVYSYVNRERKS